LACGRPATAENNFSVLIQSLLERGGFCFCGCRKQITGTDDVDEHEFSRGDFTALNVGAEVHLKTRMSVVTFLERLLLK
jgi:hypothetical protein